MTPTPTTGDLLTTRLEALIATGTDAVLLATVDAQGRLKGKEFDATYFLRHLADGGTAEACAYLLATDVDMTPADGFALTSWGTGYGDLTLLPDPNTLRVLPWTPGAAMVLADPLDTQGRPLPIAPRAVLRHQLDLLADLGYTVRVGLESEFVLLHGTTADLARGGYRRLRPVTWDNRDYALDLPNTVRGYTRALRAALAGAGLPVEAIKAESAPGQIEVTFPYGDPMQACGQHVLMKHAARVIGEQHRMTPVFMAAPMDGTGSGLHLHLSLWREEEPAVPGDGPGGISQVGGQAVAGLLEHLPGLALLYAPNTNSYKRFADGSFAPTRMLWGPDNRTCAVRVAGHGSNTHLEIRVPGADANPFLALAAAVAAIRDGIKRGSIPGPATTANGYLSTTAALVPPSLEQAIETFTAGSAEELLGADTAAHYTQLARVEARWHQGRVTDREQQRGIAQT